MRLVSSTDAWQCGYICPTHPPSHLPCCRRVAGRWHVFQRHSCAADPHNTSIEAQVPQKNVQKHKVCSLTRCGPSHRSPASARHAKYSSHWTSASTFARCTAALYSSRRLRCRLSSTGTPRHVNPAPPPNTSSITNSPPNTAVNTPSSVSSHVDSSCSMPLEQTAPCTEPRPPSACRLQTAPAVRAAIASTSSNSTSSVPAIKPAPCTVLRWLMSRLIASWSSRCWILSSISTQSERSCFSVFCTVWWMACSNSRASSSVHHKAGSAQHGWQPRLHGSCVCSL